MYQSQKARTVRNTLLGGVVVLLIANTYCGAVGAAETPNSDQVLKCLGYAGQAGPATVEGATFDVLAALAVNLPIKANYAYLAPVFQGQSEDFWRGFMIAMATDNAPRFSSDEARRFFVEAGCAALIE